MIKLNKLLDSRAGYKYAAAAISGFFSALPLIVPQAFIISWISLIPFFYVLFISKIKFRTGFKLFLTYGIVYFMIVYTWFFSLVALDMQDYPYFKYIKTGIWMGVALIQGLQFSLAGLLYKAVNGKKIFKALSLPFIWIIIEWFQEQTIWGMPWGRLSMSQYYFLPAIQSASLLGSLFVSFLIVLTNSLAAYALTQKENKKIFKNMLIASLCVFVLNSAFGMVRLSVLKSRNYQTVEVAAIQGNLPSASKWENEGRTSFDIYMDLSKQAADNGAKIILWPETAVPVYISEGGYYDTTYKQFADENDVYLITGGFYDDEGNNYSTLVLYTPDGDGGLDNAYKKRHLVPFGEYVPYRELILKLLPFMADFRMLGDDLTPSLEKTVLFSTEYGDMNGLICFDSIFTHLCQSDVKNGSELILIGTNDSYYSESLNPYQHNGQAVFRAVENGRYVVRAANTGISSIITPYGNYNQTVMNERTILSGNISFIQNKTLYSIAGNIIVLIGALFCVFVFIYSRKMKQ